MTAENGRWVGSPYAPHMDANEEAILDAVGVDSVEDLFDIPGEVRFDGELGVDSTDEQESRNAVVDLLSRNEGLTEFLSRDHHAHYVPTLTDDLSRRSGFPISYTQYQPKIAQGFL